MNHSLDNRSALAGAAETIRAAADALAGIADFAEPIVDAIETDSFADLIAEKGISRDAKLLLLTLDRIVDEFRRCAPTIPELCDLMGAQRNAVYRWLIELERAELIARYQSNHGPTVIWVKTCYYVASGATKGTAIHKQLPLFAKDAPQQPSRTRARGLAPVSGFGSDIHCDDDMPRTHAREPVSSSSFSENHIAWAKAVGPKLVAIGMTRRSVQLVLCDALRGQLYDAPSPEAGMKRVDQQLLWLPYRNTKRDPAGMLFQAITRGWAPPKAFAKAVDRADALLSFDVAPAAPKKACCGPELCAEHRAEHEQSQAAVERYIATMDPLDLEKLRVKVATLTKSSSGAQRETFERAMLSGYVRRYAMARGEVIA